MTPVGPEPARRKVAVATAERYERDGCPYVQEAVELVGKRWTGAIVFVLMAERRPLRFGQIGEAIPRLSDRLLSERMKELEARGIVERRVQPGSPARVEYELTEMGLALEPALDELRSWAQHWLD